MSKETSNTLTINNHSKKNIKIWVYSFKQNGLSILFGFFSICLILFSNSNLIATKNALTLWVTAVVPSLFPFFVATELLTYTNIVPFLGKHLTPITKLLFGVSGEGAFAFLMGLISGYPVGANIVAKFMEDGICTQNEAERMLAFTNNSGPLFIIGTVGISLFSSTTIGILLFITHILACISVGIVLNVLSLHKSKKNILFNRKSNFYKNKTINISSLGEILRKSITNSTSTILLIGGFVVIFSVILSIMNQSYLLAGIGKVISPIFSSICIPNELVKPFISGIIELTNGISSVANVHVKSISISLVLSAFLLGFGGFSVLLQVLSIISKTGLSIKTYFVGKLLQGVFASLYTYIAIQFLPFLQLNL